MPEVKIAVIVSTYNRKQFLAATLESLLKTQKHPMDIYVLDDGSTDGTKEMMEEYIPRIKRYIYFEKNRGLRWILNYGIQKLIDNYDYISYTQDDVIYVAQWLDQCLKVWNDRYGFLTCHEAPEHPTIGERNIKGVRCVLKPSCRATHLFASNKRWKDFGEIPELTPGVAAPKMGQGSMVDWWLMGHDDYPESNNSLRKINKKVVVLPALCVHFGHTQSTWGMINPEKWVIESNEKK